jgi:hypothetical protein
LSCLILGSRSRLTAVCWKFHRIASLPWPLSNAWSRATATCEHEGHFDMCPAKIEVGTRMSLFFFLFLAPPPPWDSSYRDFKSFAPEAVSVNSISLAWHKNYCWNCLGNYTKRTLSSTMIP